MCAHGVVACGGVRVAVAVVRWPYTLRLSRLPSRDTLAWNAQACTCATYMSVLLTTDHTLSWRVSLNLLKCASNSGSMAAVPLCCFIQSVAHSTGGKSPGHDRSRLFNGRHGYIQYVSMRAACTVRRLGGWMTTMPTACTRQQCARACADVASAARGGGGQCHKLGRHRCECIANTTCQWHPWIGTFSRKQRSGDVIRC